MARGPAWVDDAPCQPKAVRFEEAAERKIAEAVLGDSLDFYQKQETEAVLAAVGEVLRLDIRSVYRGRGRDTGKELFRARFDRLELAFQTHEHEIVVVEVDIVL